MGAKPIFAVVVSEGSQVATLLEQSGIGRKFQCRKVDLSNHWYLQVQVELPSTVGQEMETMDLMIPHRDVVLVALNVPPRMIGFRP